MNTIDLYETVEWLDLHFEAKKAFRLENSSYFDIRSGDRLLDVGCGTGSWTKVYLNLVGRSGEVVGIDILQDNIDKANKRNFASNVKYQRSSLDEVHTVRGEFDVIMLGNVFGYIQQPQRTLIELKKKLKTGGRIIVRQHDEGAMLLNPVSEQVLSRVKAAVAWNSSTISKESLSLNFDIYAGRKLFFELQKSNFEKVERRITNFEALPPFDKNLKRYINFTLSWMYEKSKNRLTEADIDEWDRMGRLFDKDDERCYFFEVEYLCHAYI